MTDDRSVEAQSHEIQKTGHEISSEGISIDDQFQDAVIIDKLPQLWKDFKNTLRNKTKEATRRHDQKEEVNTISRTQSTAILKPNLKLKGNKMKRGSNKQNNSQKPQSRSTIQIVCYNCNKPEHLSKNCRNENHPAVLAILVEEELVVTIT